VTLESWVLRALQVEAKLAPQALRGPLVALRARLASLEQASLDPRVLQGSLELRGPLDLPVPAKSDLLVLRGLLEGPRAPQGSRG
jgi:hypothetical protein